LATLDYVISDLISYTRRYFERKGDNSSMQRAEEIRRFYKQIIRDYVYIVRSIIPDEIIDDHLKIYCKRLKEI
jgi:hypothetical protein